MCQIYSKVTTKTTEPTTFGDSIVNFEHILHFTIITVEFNQINAGSA